MILFAVPYLPNDVRISISCAMYHSLHFRPVWFIYFGSFWFILVGGRGKSVTCWLVRILFFSSE